MLRVVGYLVLGFAGFAAFAVLPMLWASPAPDRKPWGGPALADLTYEETRIEANGVTLFALVFAPADPKSVVTVIHGSGPSRRDHGWYTGLVAHLNSRDIAVILPDKRGSERSTGDWRTASMLDLAGDAEAVLDFARTRFPDLPLGVLGTSQGGWIAPILASRRPELAFVINQSGAAVPAFQQLVHEETSTLVGMGMPRLAASVVGPVSAWILREIRLKDRWNAIGPFDPLSYWQNVSQPALVLYGALDEFDNVPVALSVKRLESLGKPNIRVEVLKGLGHSMNAPGSGAISGVFLDLVVEMATSPERS